MTLIRPIETKDALHLLVAPDGFIQLFGQMGKELYHQRMCQVQLTPYLTTTICNGLVVKLLYYEELAN